MVSEYDLPCTECGSNLTRAVVQDSIPVAECPDCGARHYPEPALSTLQSGVGDAGKDEPV